MGFLVLNIRGQRINRALRQLHETRERTVERSIVDTASGDEYRCAGWWRFERQRRSIAKLVHRLSNVRGPHDVFSRALRLPQLKYQSAPWAASVRWVTRQTPIQMEQAGESGDIGVG